MLRGHRSIFTSLFPDDTTTAPAVVERKGRSEVLLLKRNEALICRYYWLVKIEAKQYQITLAQLEDEFFISERTIIDILQQNSGILKALVTDKTNTSFFKKKYPWLSW
jgi:hypothetical protein